MKINTTFNCGDKGWVYQGGSVHQLTVGQIGVTIVDSNYYGSTFDNFRPQKKYEERYMCVETGIGSGTVYTLNESIFLTEEDCRAANDTHIKEQEVAKQKRRLYEIEEAKREFEVAKKKLEQLEKEGA